MQGQVCPSRRVYSRRCIDPSCAVKHEIAALFVCFAKVQHSSEPHTWLAFSTDRLSMAARVQVRVSSTAGLLRMSFSYSRGWSASSKVSRRVRPAKEAPCLRNSYRPLQRCTSPALNALPQSSCQTRVMMPLHGLCAPPMASLLVQPASETLPQKLILPPASLPQPNSQCSD